MTQANPTVGRSTGSDRKTRQTAPCRHQQVAGRASDRTPRRTARGSPPGQRVGPLAQAAETSKPARRNHAGIAQAASGRRLADAAPMAELSQRSYPLETILCSNSTSASTARSAKPITARAERASIWNSKPIRPWPATPSGSSSASIRCFSWPKPRLTKNSTAKPPTMVHAARNRKSQATFNQWPAPRSDAARHRQPGSALCTRSPTGKGSTQPKWCAAATASTSPKTISITEASELIDQLKGQPEGTGGRR